MVLAGSGYPKSAATRHTRPPTRKGQGAGDRVVFERQRKVYAPTGFTIPDLGHVWPHVVAGPPETVRLQTTYYDSADLALATSGISLRFRTGEAGPAWSLKAADAALPSTSTQRKTYFDEPEGEVPAAARDLLHIHLRSRVLLAVARLDTIRTIVRLFGSGPVGLADVIHDRVTAYRAGEQISEFDEIEVQVNDLSQAGSDLRRAIVATLVSAGCSVAPPTPKLLRAFGIFSPPGPPGRASALPGTSVLGVADLVGHTLAASVTRLMAHDVGVRQDEDIEDVHQLRVAARRMRSDLRALGYLLDPEWMGPLRSELRWLGSVAGPVRDADVLLDRLQSTVAALPDSDTAAGTQILMRLSDRRGRCRDAMLAGMRSDRYDLLLDALADAVAHPRLTPAASELSGTALTDALANAVRKQWKALVRAVRKLGPGPSARDLHQIRIRAKRARYTAEAAEPALGRPAARVASAATAIQTLLGELQDATVAEAWLRTITDDTSLARAAGELIAAEQAKSERLRRAWPQAWKSAEKNAARGLAAFAAGS